MQTNKKMKVAAGIGTWHREADGHPLSLSLSFCRFPLPICLPFRRPLPRSPAFLPPSLNHACEQPPARRRDATSSATSPPFRCSSDSVVSARAAFSFSHMATAAVAQDRNEFIPKWHCSVQTCEDGTFIYSRISLLRKTYSHKVTILIR